MRDRILAAALLVLALLVLILWPRCPRQPRDCAPYWQCNGKLETNSPRCCPE